MSDAVLLVDDEEHILLSLKRLLRRDGYDIHLADGGPAALEILKETEIAVIVCDQRMPGMSGAEVLAEAYRIRPDTVRITLTGYTDLAAAQASINEGHVSHFLLKPWDDTNLRSVVAEGVRAYRLVQENRRLETLTRRQKEELEAWNRKLEVQVRERTEALRQQNARLLDLQQRVEQSLRDTVGVLSGVQEAYSPNLGIHSGRVADLARQMAARLDLEDQQARDVEFAAYLHDLGMLSDLSRPHRHRPHAGSEGRHSVAELHSEAGFAILQRVGGFEEVALAVRHQGEHYDGSGKPDGLEGDAIPLAARIIAITDAYDKAVFCTEDPLKVSREAGRKALLQGRGHRFDPALVDLLLWCLDSFGADNDLDDEIEMSPMKIRPGMTLARPIHNLDGILLLKEGTVLTPDMIERIRALSAADPLLTHVFVRCEREDPAGGETPARPIAPPPLPASTRRRGPATAPAGKGAVLRDREPIPPQATAPADETRTSDASAAGASGGAPRERPARGAPIESLSRGASAESAPPHTSGESQPRGMSWESPPPGAPGARPPREASGPGTFRGRPAPRGKALLVDDSVLVCNALRRELRQAGIETVATESGWTALNLVENGHFDIALVDLMMPAMSGEELLKRLLERAPDLPCIILTGNATKDRVLALAKAPNVANILTKPWDHHRLLAAIEKALGPRAEKVEETPVNTAV